MFLEQIVLVSLVILAIVAVNTSQLRQAVVYVSIFSLLASFAYLLFQAPDVAIAEAIIGCGLTTVLYLVAIRRQRLLTLYFVYEDQDEITDHSTDPITNKLLHAIKTLFAEKDLQSHVIQTMQPYQSILDHEDFDLVIVQNKDHITIFGRDEDNHFNAVAKLSEQPIFDNLTIFVQPLKGGSQSHASHL